jgi:biopolymer transport protein ExbD
MFDDEDEGMPRIDLTPLVDVIFMLVIFFIMTASFDLPVLEMQLPQSSQTGRVQVHNRVKVAVDSEGTIMLGRKEAGMDDIAAALSSGKEPVLEVLIDRRAPSGILVQMADLAREKAGGRILIAVQGDPKSGSGEVAH